jgi:hypothetical protein
MDDFSSRRAAALDILQRSEKLTRKAGSFLGQCAVDPSPLSDRQLEWFLTLAERAGVQVETFA